MNSLKGLNMNIIYGYLALNDFFPLIFLSANIFFVLRPSPPPHPPPPLHCHKCSNGQSLISLAIAGNSLIIRFWETSHLPLP